MPGTDCSREHEQYVRILLAPDATGSEVLRRIVELVEVEEFRSEEPDLEEIFVTAVRNAGIAMEEVESEQ